MWLRSPAAENDKCPWNEQMSYACAKGVHLAILKWASEHGCPWGADVAMLAAAGAHLEEVLKYGWKQGYPMQPGPKSEAAVNGHVHILAWFRELESGQAEEGKEAEEGLLPLLRELEAEECRAKEQVEEQVKSFAELKIAEA